MSSVAEQLFTKYEADIKEAVALVSSGLKRVDVAAGIKVYACKNIIRIDIKNA